MESFSSSEEIDQRIYPVDIKIETSISNSDWTKVENERSLPEFAYRNRFEDAKSILTEDITKNIISESNKDLYGTIVCRIKDHKCSSNAQGLGLLMIFTLGIPGYLGVPHATDISDVQLEVNIIDISGNSAAKYSESGKGKAHIANYWGYRLNKGEWRFPNDNFDVSRASNAIAIQDAFQKIKEQLKHDAIQINRKLVESVKIDTLDE